MSQKGKIIVAAKANLRPFQAPMGRAIEIEMRSEIPVGDLDSTEDEGSEVGDS